MSRPILPLPTPSHPYLFQQYDRQPEPPVPPPPGPSKPTYAKRGKITIVACVPCRKRKTKCDGKRPACSQCTTRDGVCMYDMTDEQRRLTYLRDNVETLAEGKSALESLLWTLQTASEEQVTEIVQRLRSGEDFHAIAQQVHGSRRLSETRPGEGSTASIPMSGYAPSPSPAQRLQQYNEFVQTITDSTTPELDEIVRRLRLHEDVSTVVAAAKAGSLLQPLSIREAESTPGIEAEYSSGAQTFGLVKGTATHATRVVQTRSPDTHTPALMNQPWTTVTADDDFLNHLLSLYFTWQHSFFQGFPDVLFQEDMLHGRTKYCSSLLVNAICAAGCLLSTRPQARRDPNDPKTAGLDFFDEAVRLLNEDATPSITTTAALYLLCHVEGNRGHLSSLWTYSGRSARMALDINLHLRSDKLASESLTGTALKEEEEAARLHAFWGCFISDQVTSFTLGRLPQIPVNAITVDLPPISADADAEEWKAYDLNVVKRPGARSTTFNQVAALSKIVNSTLQMFFAPAQILSGSILLDEYNKYLSFYKKLPQMVANTDDAPPHVLSLHMYYHAAVLLLFRPFLKAKFTESDVSPRDVCRQSANAISDLFEQHVRLYDHVGLYTFQVHCLLTACTIHIINVPTISSTKYLTAACNSFQGLVHRNEWATGSLNIIKGLVQKWNIILPLEAESALYRNSDVISSFDFSAESSTSGSQAEIFRPEKRSHFLKPSSQVMQKRQRLAPRETREQPTNYLFAPFPNQPAPLLGPIHTSTSADTEWNDELNKVAQGFDGLNFSGDDWFDPFMGYQGESSVL